MEYFKNLPVEITLDILTRLPTESVLECKSVCTNWNNLVSHHPSFSKLHSNRLNDSGKGFLAFTYDENLHYFEYNDESTSPIQRITRINLNSPIRDSLFVGSCNGLICLARGPLVCICNPITREQVMLPKIKRYCNLKQYRYWTCGFGYVSSTDEYKILGIYTGGEVYMYTLGSGNGWRKLGNFNFESSSEWDQGIFANGALYWMDRTLDMIITFDLVEEKFCKNLAPPPLPTGGDWLDIRIGVLGGCLYIAVGSVVLEGGDRVKFDIWLLENKSVNHEMKEQEEHRSSAWSKEFRIDKKKLFAVTESDCVLTYESDCLNIYHTKTSTSKRLVKFKSLLLQVSPHKNTLTSLKELGEEGTETMESVEIEETRSRDYSFEQL